MEQKNSFTIHTELLDSTLQGARNIYMGANSTCHLYVIPRDEISLADSIVDIAGQPAFYILLGDLNTSKPTAYIGQTTDFANRKNDHLQKKDWWKSALIFISDNHKIYGDDVKYLEFLGIELAQKMDSYNLVNGANPKKPTIAPFRINDMEVFFRDIQLLTRFYGCGIFDYPKSIILDEKQRHYFYVKTTDRPAEGKGYYNNASGTFVLLKGTILASEVVPSYSALKFREDFIVNNCKTEKNKIILQHDTEVNSVSGASGIVLGRPSNGWIDWKDIDGKTLKDYNKEIEK